FGQNTRREDGVAGSEQNSESCLEHAALGGIERGSLVLESSCVGDAVQLRLYVDGDCTPHGHRRAALGARGLDGATQLRQEVHRRAVTAIRLFLHRARDDGVERRRDGGLSARPWRRGLAAPAPRLVNVTTREWATSRDQLV